MEIISMRDVSKDYIANGIVVKALKGIDLSISRGEFSALAGPSGSGKTTLLNLVGALDMPSTGIINVSGENIAGYSASQRAALRLRHIGFVFQAYNLVPVLSALENVEYVLLLQGLPVQERRKRASEMLERVGLADQMNRRPSEMSGGQQQRVAVARAIVSRPDIVLADEPTANLDQKTGAMLLDMMHGLNKELGITFLFSTHDTMVMERAERLLHLVDGVIVTDENKSAKKSKRTAKKAYAKKM